MIVVAVTPLDAFLLPAFPPLFSPFILPSLSHARLLSRASLTSRHCTTQQDASAPVPAAAAAAASGDAAAGEPVSPAPDSNSSQSRAVTVGPDGAGEAGAAAKDGAVTVAAEVESPVAGAVCGRAR